MEGCSSGGSVPQDDGGFGHDGVYAMTTYNIHTGMMKCWFCYINTGSV